MSVHNLKEFEFAKQMVEEIPSALLALENSRDTLKKYNGFNSVSRVINDIEAAIMNLETNLPYFQNVVKDKGGQFE